MTATTPAYYCIVQYTPSQVRGEVVNIGVLLFCPETAFLDVELTGSEDRVVQFFGPDQDLGAIRLMKQGVRNRLRVEADSFRTLEDLQHFVDTRANHIVLTSPRPTRIGESPREDLHRLYHQFVDDHPESAASGVATTPGESRTNSVPAPEAPAAAVPVKP